MTAAGARGRAPFPPLERAAATGARRPRTPRTWSWPHPRPAVAETESPWEASAVVACAAGVDPGQMAPEEESHAGAWNDVFDAAGLG